MSKRHNRKEIQAVIDTAISRGWRLLVKSGHTHVWGELYCSDGTRNGCIIRIYSTPRKPESFARRIAREIAKCPHGN